MKALGVVTAVVALAVGCGKKEAKDEVPATDEPAAAAPAETKSPARDAAPPPIDAAPAPEVGAAASCAMLTKAEIEALLKTPVGDGKPENARCSWDAASGGDKGTTFELRPASQFEVAQKIARDMAEKGGPKGSYEELAGLGEAAFYSNLAGHQVVFRVGDRYAKLGLLGLKDEASKKRAIELAAALADKMK